ncbi:UPF0538 protein C2orf76 homolog isoform X3 [Mobula birostris]|uniref:UPF0538 protein C2orf76 homolog isoform X3 n=1 Tax=Mobula birostris TaxID=1983395 RepID=UPI003B282529
MTEGIRPTGERVQEVTEACEPKRHRSEKCWLQRQIHTTVCNCVRTTKAIDQEEYPVQVQRRTETDVPGLSEDPMRWHLMWTCCSARQIGVDPNQTSLSKHFMAVDLCHHRGPIINQHYRGSREGERVRMMRSQNIPTL